MIGKKKIPYDHICEGKYHIDIYVKGRKKNEVDNITKNVNFSTFHFMLPTDKKVYLLTVSFNYHPILLITDHFIFLLTIHFPTDHSVYLLTFHFFYLLTMSVILLTT